MNATQQQIYRFLMRQFETNRFELAALEKWFRPRIVADSVMMDPSTWAFGSGGAAAAGGEMRHGRGKAAPTAIERGCSSVWRFGQRLAPGLRALGTDSEHQTLRRGL
ncbi:MAG: hypothetical protein IPM01_19440 [Burkholderiaceae bacterium]|nr:hypothetical protein [Burkholderiaceae bacterium]